MCAQPPLPPAPCSRLPRASIGTTHSLPPARWHALLKCGRPHVQPFFVHRETPYPLARFRKQHSRPSTAMMMMTCRFYVNQCQLYEQERHTVTRVRCLHIDRAATSEGSFSSVKSDPDLCSPCSMPCKGSSHSASQMSHET
jgi:hypothetical protein